MSTDANWFFSIHSFVVIQCSRSRWIGWCHYVILSFLAMILTIEWIFAACFGNDRYQMLWATHGETTIERMRNVFDVRKILPEPWMDPTFFCWACSLFYACHAVAIHAPLDRLQIIQFAFINDDEAWNMATKWCIHCSKLSQLTNKMVQ